VRDYLVRAEATAMPLTTTELLALREPRRNCERRMGELLLGDCRPGRSQQPGNPDPGKVSRGRLAHNNYRGAAVHQRVFYSLSALHMGLGVLRRQGSPKASGTTAPLRALTNRWLELLWHCLTHSLSYDEDTHLRNRHNTRAAA
jgi:hypothetical protein